MYATFCAKLHFHSYKVLLPSSSEAILSQAVNKLRVGSVQLTHSRDLSMGKCNLGASPNLPLTLYCYMYSTGIVL